MKFLKVLGYILFFGCGLYLYVMSLIFYYSLWGLLGLIIAIFVFPAAEVFPIVVWIVTKQFPSLLFILWGIGWFGMILAGIGKSREESYFSETISNVKAKKEKFRGLSISALVTGILSLTIGILFLPFNYLFEQSTIYQNVVSGVIAPVIGFGLIVAAIVCGSIDLKRIRSGLYGRKGKGFDIAGIVLGSLNILILLILLGLLWLGVLM